MSSSWWSLSSPLVSPCCLGARVGVTLLELLVVGPNCVDRFLERVKGPSLVLEESDDLLSFVIVCRRDVWW